MSFFRRKYVVRCRDMEVMQDQFREVWEHNGWSPIPETLVDPEWANSGKAFTEVGARMKANGLNAASRRLGHNMQYYYKEI